MEVPRVDDSHKPSAGPGVLPISVVIPAFNAQLYIAQALHSVARQTQRPSEVIVVDDGSIDDTVQIAASFGVRLIRQRNAGPSAARNAGIRASASAWIAFLDADDQWDRDKLERFWLSHLRRPDASFLFSDYRCERDGVIVTPSFINGTGAFTRLRRTPLEPETSFVERNDLMRLLLIGNFIIPSAVMVRRDLAVEVPFDESLRSDSQVHVSEDHEIYFRYLRRTDALRIERPLTSYRIVPQSLSSDGLKCWRGYLEMIQLFASAPDVYVPGVLSGFRELSPTIYRNIGILYLRACEPVEARRFFMRSLKARVSLRSTALFVATTLLSVRGGAGLLKALRAMWRGGLKGLYRRLRQGRGTPVGAAGDAPV
jgi:glycosyltransferase involved in cell wall biosynthesis